MLLHILYLVGITAEAMTGGSGEQGDAAWIHLA